FDTVGVPVLGVSGRHRTPGTQRLDVIQADVVTGEIQLDVLGQARMAARQNKPVPADPGGVCRIMTHEALIDHVCRRRQTHGGARMPVADVLYRVGGQYSDRVDGTTVDVSPFKTVLAHVLAPDLFMPNLFMPICLGPVCSCPVCLYPVLLVSSADNVIRCAFCPTIRAYSAWPWTLSGSCCALVGAGSMAGSMAGPMAVPLPGPLPGPLAGRVSWRGRDHRAGPSGAWQLWPRLAV